MWDLHTLPTGAYFCDPEGWIQQANPEALKIWGLQPSQLQSRRFCPAQRRLGPDGTELSIEQTPPARAVRLGRPVRNARILITRADSRLWWVRADASPIFEQGKLTGAIVLMRGTPARRDPAPWILSRMEEGYVGLDSQKRIVVANSTFLRWAKLPRKKLHGALWQEIWGQVSTSLQLQTRTYPEPWGQSIYISRPSRESWEIEHALYAAAHEIRTPLTALKLTLDGALRLTASDPLQKLLIRGEKNLQAAQTILSQVVDVARLRLGRETLRLARIDLRLLFENVVERLQPLLSYSNCEVKVQAPYGLVGRWDPGRIEQVLSNLLVNACRYGGPGQISLRAEADPEKKHALITLEDSGNRPAGPLSEHFPEGMGIGLFIVRRILEAHSAQFSLSVQAGQPGIAKIELPFSLGEDSKGSAETQA